MSGWEKVIFWIGIVIVSFVCTPLTTLVLLSLTTDKWLR